MIRCPLSTGAKQPDSASRTRRDSEYQPIRRGSGSPSDEIDRNLTDQTLSAIVRPLRRVVVAVLLLLLLSTHRERLLDLLRDAL